MSTETRGEFDVPTVVKNDYVWFCQTLAFAGLYRSPLKQVNILARAPSCPWPSFQRSESKFLMRIDNDKFENASSS